MGRRVLTFGIEFLKQQQPCVAQRERICHKRAGRPQVILDAHKVLASMKLLRRQILVV